MHFLVRPVLYTACLCSLGDCEDFCCNFCYCPILCFKIKFKKNPYEYSLNAVLYVCIHVGEIILYHYMSLKAYSIQLDWSKAAGTAGVLGSFCPPSKAVI